MNQFSYGILSIIYSLLLAMGLTACSGSTAPSSNISEDEQASTPIDIIAPELSNPLPSGVMDSSTTTVNLSVTTNEIASCRYSSIENETYEDMIAFASTGSALQHSSNINVSSGQNYQYYFKCQDSETNTSNDLDLQFSIAETQTPNQQPTPTRYQASHYASPVASNGSGDGSISNPWSWDDLLTNLSAGMIVELAPGSFSKPATGSRLIPAFDINDKQGTEQNPIIIYAQYRASTSARNQPQLRTIFETTGADQSGSTGNPILSITDSSFVTLDGFYIDTNNAPLRRDTGALRIWGNGRGNKVLYNHIIGAQTNWTGTDNYVAIRHEGWNVNDNLFDSEIAYNLIEIDPNLPADTDIAFGGIECYSGRNISIHHNEVRSNWGIQLKNNYGFNKYVQAPVAIHHNFIRGQYKTLWLFGPVSEDDGVEYIDVYQNISIATNKWPLEFEPTTFGAPFSDTPTTEWIRIVNNVFYSPNTMRTFEGLVFGTGSVSYTNVFLDNLFQNNIFKGESGDGVYHFYTENIDVTDNAWRYNNYSGFSQTSFAYFGNSFSGSYSEWTATHETTATNSEPEFVDITAEDFKLSPSSNALNAGIDVLNLLGNGVSNSINQGAYILTDQSDIIGIPVE